jgi:hypothetical protein
LRLELTRFNPRKSGLHFLHALTPQLVLAKHDADGSSIPGNTGLLQCWENQSLFLSVVAFVDKYREKLQELIHVLGIIRCSLLLDLMSDTLQHLERQAHGIMLQSQFLNGFYK